MVRIRMALLHAIPSIIGLTRMFLREPVFASRLLWLRFCFFVTRRMLFALRDRRGFVIGTHHVLISYWDFFVERGLQSGGWNRDLVMAKNPVAVDVGANAGVFTYLLSTVNPSIEVFAYEPLPELKGPLLEIGKLFQGRLHVFSAACGDKEGKVRIMSGEPGDTNAQVAKSDNDYAAITTDAVTLDGTIPSDIADILLIKIDTQGYEYNVLSGGTKTIAKTRYLIVEATEDAELERIRCLLGKTWSCSKISYCDYLFSRRTQSEPTVGS